jgi:hypothetical protein
MHVPIKEEVCMTTTPTYLTSWVGSLIYRNLVIGSTICGMRLFSYYLALGLSGETNITKL